MLVMKVVDKEFLFPSTHFCSGTVAPKEKFNTSFLSLLSNNGLHHPCPFAHEIHLQRQPLHPRLSIAHARTGGLCHIASATSQGETAVFSK